MNFLLLLKDSAWQERIAFCLIFAVVVIWPIPDTTAARYGLLGLLLILGLVGCRQWRTCVDAWRLAHDKAKRQLLLILLLLAVFTVWVSIQAGFFSLDPGQIFHNLKGQWYLQVVIFFTAILLVNALHGRWRDLLITIYWGVWFLLAALFVMSLWRLAQTGALPDRWGGLPGTLRNGMNNTAMTTTTFWMLLLADLMNRITTGRWIFQRSLIGWLAVLALTLFGLYIQNTRTSLVVIGVMTLVVTLPYAVRWVWGMPRHRIRRLGTVILGIAISVSLIFTYVSRDPRWNTLAQTIPIAWNIDKNKAWRAACNWNDPACVQRLPDGRVVDGSNYLRIAWLHASINELLRHPLGVGYRRGALGKALQLSYPHDKIDVSRAENSFWTLGIGTGWPGLVLMLAFLSYLGWVGWLQTRRGEWIYILLPLLVGKTLLASFSRFVLFNSNMEFLMFIFGIMVASLMFVDKSQNLGSAIPAVGIAPHV